jgi:hypothetical protein
MLKRRRLRSIDLKGQARNQTHDASQDRTPLTVCNGAGEELWWTYATKAGARSSRLPRVHQQIKT